LTITITNRRPAARNLQLLLRVAEEGEEEVEEEDGLPVRQ
jgi:hypothetical protein